MTDPPSPPIEPEGSLLGRVLEAGAWATGLRGLTKLVAIVRVSVLARLLSPDDFGLFGIALLALSLVEALSYTGFDAALIRRDDDIRPYLSTAWTLQAIRGLGLAIVLLLAAPLVAAFFEEPAAAPLLQVLSANALLLGLTNIGVTIFNKELQFRRYSAYQFGGTLVDLVASIWAAFALRSAWALVIGMLAGSCARMVISHVMAPRVRFEIDRERAKLLARFGRWMWGARIASYALLEGDDIVVAKMMGIDALGIYRMAYLYGNLPATEITHVVSAVSFPAYSKLQNDAAGLRDAFLRTLRVTMFVSTPFAVGIILMAPGFVRLFLGSPESNPWLSMIVPMQILAVWGLIRSLGATVGALLQGAGRPDIIAKIAYLKLAVLAAIIYPLTVRWGVEGAAIAVVAASLVSNPIADYSAIKVTGCRAAEFIGAVAFPLAGSSLMAVAVYNVQRAAGPDYQWLVFALSIVIGAITYGFAYVLLRGLFGYDIVLAFKRSQRDPGA